MKIIKNFLIRLLVVVVPLLGWYFYSEMAYRANRLKEHPTDAGLGMVFLLVFILIILFIGFVIDLIIKLRGKQYKIAWIDLFFLVLFAVPVLYFLDLYQ